MDTDEMLRQILSAIDRGFSSLKREVADLKQDVYDLKQDVADLIWFETDLKEREFYKKL